MRSALNWPGRWLILAITLLAFGLRVWALDQVPPGFSDDELSNAFVISQRVLDGDLRVYYTDASGHEALFHALVALTIGLFSHNVIGLRLVGAIFGTLAVPLTYLLGRRLLNRHVGLIAAAGLAVSFWSLLYSRDNQRHISMPFFMLLAFLFLWRGLDDRRGRYWPFVLAGLFQGLGLYTYFAARGVPVIILAFALYLALWQRDLFRRVWRGLGLLFVTTGLVAIPLLLSLRAQAATGADARVGELAVPVTAAQAGDWEPLKEHIVVTLSMFHSRGDGEYLYNIPDRPVFGPLPAALFWLGIALALGTVLHSWYQRLHQRSKGGERNSEHRFVFILGWWFTGLVPGFISVPPASLGHTIISQPVTYLVLAVSCQLLAVRLSAISGQRSGNDATRARPTNSYQLTANSLAAALGLILIALLASRDLPDYFLTWPNQGQTRFLFHADQVAVAAALADRPELTDVAVSGLLSGPWDRLALATALENVGRPDVQPRWYNPQRAVLLALAGQPAIAFHGYPDVARYDDAFFGPPWGQAGGYRLSQIVTAAPTDELACFANNLCLVAVATEPANGLVELTWRLQAELALPPIPIVSKPPPPDVYGGLRLAVFAQLLDENGSFLRGDDGFWVDPVTLQPGDVFRQLHQLSTFAGAATLNIGLYDPLDGQRILLADGRDAWPLPLTEQGTR